MTNHFPVNKKISIKDIGNSFTIKAIKSKSYKNNVIGKIIFSEKEKEKDISTRTLYINKDISFNISEMIENGYLEINPYFIEFRTNEVDSVTVYQ